MYLKWPVDRIILADLKTHQNMYLHSYIHTFALVIKIVICVTKCIVFDSELLLLSYIFYVFIFSPNRPTKVMYCFHKYQSMCVTFILPLFESFSYFYIVEKMWQIKYECFAFHMSNINSSSPQWQAWKRCCPEWPQQAEIIFEIFSWPQRFVESNLNQSKTDHMAQKRRRLVF